MSYDRATIEAFLDLFQVDGSQFYYNTANDYGRISLDLYTGKGDPWELYRGEHAADMRYKLNARLVDRVLEVLNEHAKEDRE